MHHEQQYQLILQILTHRELNMQYWTNAAMLYTLPQATQIWKKSCTDIAMLSLAPSCMWMVLLH